MSVAGWGGRRRFRDNKYGNSPERCFSGVMHHSRKESKRCNELQALLQGGLIRDLENHPQPSFDLVVNGVKICRYISDFRYVDVATGETVVEDCKGFRTREYILKSRLLLALHGVEVKEV
jgi:hypothetical protein